MTTRRDLLKSAAAASAGIALGQFGVDEAAATIPDSRFPIPAADSMAGIPFERQDTVRIAIVGTGLRGKSTLNEWLGVDNV
ncbi:MAG TPA: twin-arginine translocation signal domain-containing protein, partial [Gemmatimonadaceae bacterium]|nr:twin-arginine translocation signal domain-containing protein [Gemmatimonadaceae bacterium]